MAFLSAKTWGDAPRAVRVGALGALSLALLLTARYLGDKSPMRLRLTSVLSMGSAIAATGSIIFASNQDGAPWAPFLAGCIIATYSFIKYGHEILHIGAYGYLFFTGFMTLGRFTGVEPENSIAYPMYWVILATIWIYMASLSMIDQNLGYLIGAATYFLATVFLFGTDHRITSYLVSLFIIPVMGWLFLRDRKWPLLLGVVAVTTVTTGVVVAGTLGASVGALVALLIAGIALISTALIAIRRS